MAKCEICGKDMAFGIQVSHSHRRSNRTWKPNIKRVRAIVNGSPKRIYACTVACVLVRLPALCNGNESEPFKTIKRGPVKPVPFIIAAWKDFLTA